MPTTEQRLAELEAAEQIRNLVFGYLRAYDARDFEAVAETFDPLTREESMAALRARTQPGRTFHLAAEPVLTFEGPDAASGVVTCRAEAEVGEQWIVAGMVYRDRYLRRGERWYLASREAEVAYASDVLSRP
jgi:hypothetical protein